MLTYHVAAKAPKGTLRGIVGMTFLDQRIQQVRDETAHDIVSSRAGIPLMGLLDPLGIPPDLHRFTIERDAAGIQTLYHDLLATPMPLARLSFTFPAPPADSLPLYEAIFGMRPDFDAPENLIAFGPRAFRQLQPAAMNV